MRSQRGVTATSMVIIIVILIMLAGYSVLTSREVITEANTGKYFQEVKLINDQMKNLSLDKKNFKNTLEAFKIEDNSQYNSRVGNNLLEGKDYYFLGFADESMTEVMKQTLNEVLDVRSVENSYIVSYEDTGKVTVLLLDGVRVGDKYLYTYEEIHNAYSNLNKK